MTSPVLHTRLLFVRTSWRVFWRYVRLSGKWQPNTCQASFFSLVYHLWIGQVLIWTRTVLWCGCCCRGWWCSCALTTSCRVLVTIIPTVVVSVTQPWFRNTWTICARSTMYLSSRAACHWRWTQSKYLPWNVGLRKLTRSCLKGKMV